MIVETSRFGQLDVDENRLITFEQGILGFPNQLRYALIQTGDNSAFYWLQAVDRPELAFVVCDPRLFIPDYVVPIRKEDLAGLGLADTEGTQVFVIVNKVNALMTGNLQGPLLINTATRAARQMVLSDKRYSTRHPLMRMPEAKKMSKTG